MAKHEQSNLRFDHVQVDLCPQQEGMILSVGSISMWLPESTVREVVKKLQAGLRASSPGIAGTVPKFNSDGSN